MFVSSVNIKQVLGLGVKGEVVHGDWSLLIHGTNIIKYL